MKNMFPLLHPATIVPPVPLNVTHRTPKSPASTFRVDKLDLDVMSHILMVLSEEPPTRMFGFLGSKATQVTPSLLKHTKLVLKI